MDENKGPSIVATAWSFTAASFLFMALRFWAKVSRSEGSLWWDDWILLVSWVLTYATALLNTIMVYALGSGRHIFAVDPRNLGPITLMANIAGTTSILAAQLSKTSFAITLLRIAIDPWIRAAVWFSIVTINLTMTANFMVQWLQCYPSERYWNPSVPGTCWAPGVQSMISLVMAAYSGAIDILLSLVPWKIVMSLQMKRAEKIGVASAMSMGIFAGAAACIKAAYIPGLAAGDFTFDSAELLIYSYVEIGLSIIAASIPAMRVLVRDKINSTRQPSKGTVQSQTLVSRPMTARQRSDLEALAPNQIRQKLSFTVEYERDSPPSGRPNNFVEKTL
ncbi:hypothetical protein RB597_007307 [Gaeumannomyces tritici]